MAKFLKSIFASSEKKKSIRESELEEDRDFTPPLDGRRKLSISRSGRMKQANKKRHELNLELYGEATQPVEKHKPQEYHVKKPTPIVQISSSVPRRLSIDPETQKEISKDEGKESRAAMPVKTPEEEIESAFEYIANIS